MQGHLNLVADALSRVELSSIESSPSPILDFEKMALAQHNCAFLCDKSQQHSLLLQTFPLSNSSHSIMCDVSAGRPCPVVPPTFVVCCLTLSLTQAFGLPRSLSRPILSGLKCTLTLRDGLILVSLVNFPK